MDSPDYDLTEKIVNKFIKDKWVSYPLSFNDLVKKLKNVNVYLTKWKELDWISWFVKKSWKLFQIYLNEDQTKERMAFTLAHELWHIYLWHLEETDIFVDKAYRKNNVQIFWWYEESQHSNYEKEANHFASCLLMPKEEVIKMLKTTKDISVLANYFKVSIEAMWYRITKLNLFNHL